MLSVVRSGKGICDHLCSLLQELVCVGWHKLPLR
jgi:hypothetical protein